MIFCGVYESEILDFHPEDNLNELWSIELTTDKHEPIFYVIGHDGENEWIWEFWYASRTAYEKVKWCIIDVAYEIENISDLMHVLDEIFLEHFRELLVEENDTKNESYSMLLN